MAGDSEEPKNVFVSFAKEDLRQRNALKEHPLLIDSSFSLVDFPVKAPQSADWQDRVQLAIRHAQGVIILVSTNSLGSSGQRWEISCAKTERKKILGVWAYANDRTHVPGVTTVPWSWDTIRRFIDSLQPPR